MSRLYVWGLNGLFQHNMAINIQRVYRGYIARKYYNKLLYEKKTKCALIIQKLYRGFAIRHCRLSRAVTKIQKLYRGVLSRRNVKKIKYKYRNVCATQIQRVVRGHLSRVKTKILKRRLRNRERYYQNILNHTIDSSINDYKNNPDNENAFIHYCLYLQFILKNQYAANKFYKIGLEKYPNNEYLLIGYAINQYTINPRCLYYISPYLQQQEYIFDEIENSYIYPQIVLYCYESDVYLVFLELFIISTSFTIKSR